jgi:hypothetical protein
VPLDWRCQLERTNPGFKWRRRVAVDLESPVSLILDETFVDYANSAMLRLTVTSSFMTCFQYFVKSIATYSLRLKFPS